MTGRGLVALALAGLRPLSPSHGHDAHFGAQENRRAWSRTLVALPFSCKMILLRSQVEGAGEAMGGRNTFSRVFRASLSLNINAQSRPPWENYCAHLCRQGTKVQVILWML